MQTIIRTATVLALGVLLGGFGGCSDGDPVAPILSPQVVDSAPPAVPTNLVAAFTDGAVKLSWDANTVDTDLQGYRVYLLAFGAVQTLVDEPLQRTWWVSPMPAAGAWSYAVTAVDSHGNESAWQAITYPGAAASIQRDDRP